ncbi:MAG: hypothetical protein DRI73_11360 [Bacteroidetes bacterium]|nr:MAG: hypothetical protein DRI73_11360 [Bacteroidota bacterium]
MLSSHTPEAESAVIAFAGYFSSHTLNSETSSIFQKIIKYNNPAAIDELLKNRTPESFFSTLEPSRSLILFALTTLSEYRFNELYKPAILVCLGILQNIYNNPEYGHKLYSLSIADIYHSAKYLKVENEKIEQLIISFLENLNNLSRMNNISTTSGNILDAHYDNSKKLESIIPLSILS